MFILCLIVLFEDAYKHFIVSKEVLELLSLKFIPIEVMTPGQRSVRLAVYGSLTLLKSQPSLHYCRR